MIAPLETPYQLVIQDDQLLILHRQRSECICISRSVGASGLSIHEAPVTSVHHLRGRRFPFHAIYGIFDLLKGPYLALVTESTTVARGPQDEPIQSVDKIELLLIPTNSDVYKLNKSQEQDEDRFLKMLTYNIKAQKLHFSYTYDLTHSLQRIASIETGVDTGSKKSRSDMCIAERADQRFAWNYPACSRFIQDNLFSWLTPIVQAYIERTDVLDVSGKSFRLLYISRRSCRRQGTRFTMRGVDSEGNVANFVETEQIALFEDGRRSSFVQIRGSIPVYWSSPVSMKYAPKVYQRDHGEEDSKAFCKHAYDLMHTYGRVVIVNLIDQKKEQRKLGEALARTVNRAASSDAHILANVRLVWFDFHHECRKMQWGNLAKLLALVEDDFVDDGFFSQRPDGTVVSRQQGVLRTNCMDNLDRTNVVQSLFARRSLLLQLDDAAALKGDVLNSPYPSLETTFKNMWGNNADAISDLYAGTGALKTDFTRTGKRTKQGAVQDGINSCVRYIMNNFIDAYRQDVVDLLLVNYVPADHRGSMAHQSPFALTNADESVEELGIKLVVLFLAFVFVEYIRSSAGWMSKMTNATIATAIVCSMIFTLLVRKGNAFGERLVRRPRLCPQQGCKTSW